VLTVCPINQKMRGDTVSHYTTQYFITNVIQIQIITVIKR